MHHTILVLLITWLSIVPVAAQEGVESASDSTASGRTSEVVNVAIGVLSLAMYIPVHELGHFTVAKLAGAREARMIFLSRDDSLPEPVFAATLVDTTGLTRTDFVLISLAGVTAGRLLAEGCDLLWRQLDHRNRYPTFGEKLLSTIFLVGRADFPAYVTQDALLNLLGAPGGDFDIFVTSVAGRNTTSRTITYLGLMGIAALDIILDWDRLAFHLGIASDIRSAAEPPPIWGLRVGLGDGGRGLGLRFHTQF